VLRVKDFVRRDGSNSPFLLSLPSHLRPKLRNGANPLDLESSVEGLRNGANRE